MANQDPKSIYDLKLHESLVISSNTFDVTTNSLTAVRVPGGWIYRSTRYTPEIFTESSVFVPMDKEFADKSVKVRSSGTF